MTNQSGASPDPTTPTKTESEDAERLKRFRRFYLPIVYGLATANFVAVIQLVSAPQLNFEWKQLVPPNLSGFLPLVGLFGMSLMVMSIPALVGFAVYTELALRRQHRTPPPVTALSLVVMPSLFAPGLTLTAFHPTIAIAYVAALIVTVFVMARAIGRIPPLS